VGLLVSLSEDSFYEKELIRALEASQAVDVTVWAKPALHPHRTSFVRKLLRLWTKLDAKFLDRGKQREMAKPQHAMLAPVHLSNVLDREARGRHENSLFDVIVCFDAERIPGLLASGVSRVWSLESGSEVGDWSSAINDRQTGNVVAGQKISTSRLLEHLPQAHCVLAECASATDAISVVRQQKRVGREHASLILRALRTSEKRETASTASDTSPALRLTQLATFVIRSIIRGVARVLRRTLGRDQWFIALRRRPEGDPALSLQNFQVIRPPQDRMYADPFLMEKEGRTYVFFEELRFTDKRGKISCLEVGASGRTGEPQVVLQTDHHLSYPFLFSWNGETYMMPEMASSGQSCVYRAVRFPDRWELSHVAFENARIYDPTICEFGGKFWLFASGVGHDCFCNSQLHLFFADSPLGPWTTHPKNPVVFDVRRARPAGQLFWWRGSLIRPGQDCSSVYGGGIQLNRIEVMSDRDYQETPISLVGPEWMRRNRGTHTISWSSQFQAVDGRRWRHKLVARMPNFASSFGFKTSTAAGRG
jgi:hypothetical protein